jgi:hypothetical protein
MSNKSSSNACNVSSNFRSSPNFTFVEFLEAVTRARGQGKAKLVKSILDSGDWRAHLEILARVYPDEYAKTEPRVIIVQQNPVPPMPPPTVTTTAEWHKEADVPPELVRYLDLLQRADRISIRKKVSAANSNGEGDK